MIGATNRREPDAVILAAGFGTRLGTLTAQRPKCLLEVAGRPILARTLDSLVSAGVRDAHLVIGHLGDQLRAFATSWSNRLRLTFTENSRAAATGTAYSLALGLSRVDAERDVLVIEADVVFADDALQRLLSADAADVTLIAPFGPYITGSAVTCDGDGRVSDWLHATHQESRFRRDLAHKTVNLTRLGTSTAQTLALVLDRCVAEKESAPLEYAMRTLVRDCGARITAIDVGDAPWFEVDTEEDLRIANSIFSPAYGSGAQH
ncbi:MAG TPA: phosphocholine cytidylyltransferase family protein [Thermoanaerobaculia bacterium]|jgi:choline kinase|nr:phosphocholine cytidylyltransferase family protein [Thermoanaerobaculia bacterium]